MKTTIDVFLRCDDVAVAHTTIEQLEKSITVSGITPLTLGEGALERMARAATDSGAAMVYTARAGV